VAFRVAAGDRRTSYHATDERITIGIAGPDARERIAGLRRQLARIGRNRGWTITEDLNCGCSQGTAETGNRMILMGEGAWSGPLLGL
jgi:hypothetical protein